LRCLGAVLALALLGPLPGLPSAVRAADGQWFGVSSTAYFRSDAAVAFDSRRGRAIAIGGTFFLQGRGGVSFLSDTDSS